MTTGEQTLLTLDEAAARVRTVLDACAAGKLIRG